MKFKAIVIFLFLGVALSTIGYILLQTKKSSFIYSDYGVAIPSDYPIIGLDISHHQGEINYEETMQMGSAKDSIQFVYIKASEGTNFLDTKFDQNAEGFAAHGMNYGFYHYYQPDRSAVKQALFYCETVKRYNFKLIPVVDIEVIGSQNKTKLVDSLTVFINKVHAILESRPMIYTYVSFYKDYLHGSSLDSELFWFASYNRKNPYMEMENAVIWQFSERGNVNGIETKVDLNVAKSNYKEKILRIR
jgi:lysozyme